MLTPDIRRGLEKYGNDILHKTAEFLMSKDPKWISSDTLAISALELMEKHSITSLFVFSDPSLERPDGIVHIHDILKLYKHGYSKVTDHATREIRHGRITKKDALKIVNHYESQPYRFDELFYNWLSVEKRSLDFVLRQFMNKEHSIRIPDKPKLKEYIKRLEPIVKRRGAKDSFSRY